MSTASVSLPAKRGFWNNRAVRRFRGNILANIGLLMVLVLTLACFIGPYLLPHDELQIDVRARFSAPFTNGHLFGTDPLGRDIAARLFHAGQISLLVGFMAMIISTVIGTLVGVVAGYRGGWVGVILMRIVDAFLAFPAIFLLLVLAAFIKPSPLMITFIIAITSWMEVARIVEAEVKSVRERDYVMAARSLGLSSTWIMFREILPNVVAPIVVAATLTVARSILMEAYVSFLGYGIQAPVPSWGNMLNGAQQYLLQAPWMAIVPGLAITMAVTGFNFIGDGLRDALDVRSAKK